MKALLVAMSPGLPRQDLARHPIGTVAASRRVAASVLPGLIGAPLPDGNLSEDCYPRDGVFAGTFGETWIVASTHDSLLEWTPSGANADRNGYRVFLQSVVTMAGFAYWGADGTVREFVGGWEDGAPVNIGAVLPFEHPFWAREQDSDGEAFALHGDDMPFNPMDLGEEALREFFGFVGEGVPRPGDLDGFEIVMHGFELLDEPALTVQPEQPKPASGGFFSRLFGGH